MNARIDSIAGFGRTAAAPADAVDLQAARGILTAIGVSLLFWSTVLLLFV